MSPPPAVKPAPAATVLRGGPATPPPFSTNARRSPAFSCQYDIIHPSPPPRKGYPPPIPTKIRVTSSVPSHRQPIGAIRPRVTRSAIGTAGCVDSKGKRKAPVSRRDGCIDASLISRVLLLSGGIMARELTAESPCHLSTTMVSHRLKQPTPRHRTSSPTYSRYTRSCNPRDVLPDDIAASAVGSYPAFSPLPLRAVVFCYACHTLTNVRPLTCAVLYVARTFLSPRRRAATRRTCTAKIHSFFYILRKKRTFVATNA